MSNQDDTAADTTVTTSAGSIEPSSSTKVDAESFGDIKVNDNKKNCDTILNNENKSCLRGDNLPSECIPSSSTNISMDKNCIKTAEPNSDLRDNALSFAVGPLPNDSNF